MKMPEFTAEASLHETSNRRHSLALDRTSPKRSVVIPQLGGGGFKGLGGCLDDCADLRPNWTAGQCRKICKDPEGIPGSGGGQKRDWASKVLCDYVGGLCAVTTGDGFLESLCLFSSITGYDGPCNCKEWRDLCLAH